MPESNQSNQEEAAEVIVVQEPTIDDVPYSQAERDQDAEDMKFMCPITMEFPIHIPTRANPSRDGVAFYIPHAQWLLHFVKILLVGLACTACPEVELSRP